MTAFDYVTLTIVGASSVIGLFRGFVKEMLSLVAWVAAFAIANAYGAELGALLPDAVPAGSVRLVVGFGLLFFGVLLLAALVNRAVAHIIGAARLKGLDHAAGGVFGFARGVVIVLTVVLLAGLTDLPRQPVWRDAWLSAPAESAVVAAKPLLPDTWAHAVRF